ncbi:MAG: TonB-dependent receptor [Anaerovibrio sp.]|uniref:TonB-dependent receptor plug domain-containing protein n=1 Tax=Anaerovibrio sp. TaxID=1872532 RepID=UPI0025FD94EF|nr:TonB-dependent receptor [Anaerovibrio sp.]MCR5177092.1 TonB-dependent receptor [Anaerovibrio sp.]
MKNRKYLGMAVALAVMAGSSSVLAADVADFGDEEVVVTATRTEKKDVDVAASTEIITAEEIKDSGVTSVTDAIKKVTGIQYDSLGDANANMGTMTNDVIMRGYADGTLVMINGTPISYRGKYDLSAIDASNVERIEVIKGNGSVLYGSAAVGGVVNIILKKGCEANSVNIGFGNRSSYKYGANVGDDRWRISYSKSMIGKKHDTSSPAIISKGELRYYTRDLSKESLNIYGKISDKWDVFYNFSENMGYYDRYITANLGYSGTAKVGDLYQSRRYDTIIHNMQAVFHDNDWKVSLFNNISFIESKGFTDKYKFLGTEYHSREKNNTYGVDAQKTWHLNNSTNLTAGFNGMRESYNAYLKSDGTSNPIYDRNIWAAFAQVDHDFDAKNNMTFGARETWTTGAYKSQNYSNFSMSGSWLHRMDEENNLYLSVAQSFKLASLSDMYKESDFAIPNPDLKPQKGINYEFGWKQNHGSHTWKAALFHTDVKDNITASWDGDKEQYQYVNVDYRNTGIELSCNIDGHDRWSYNYGIIWQHPQSKSNSDKKAQMMGKWENIYGRLQLNGGVTYRLNKFKSNLSFSYMCSRYQSQSQPNEPLKPYLLSSMNFIYTPDKHNELNLNIENLLSRRDRVSNSSSNYYCGPMTIMLNYTYKF